MIDGSAIRRYKVVPDVQSLFQRQ